MIPVSVISFCCWTVVQSQEECSFSQIPVCVERSVAACGRASYELPAARRERVRLAARDEGVRTPRRLITNYPDFTYYPNYIISYRCVNKALLLCKRSPCNPAAETALQPLI